MNGLEMMLMLWLTVTPAIVGVGVTFAEQERQKLAFTRRLRAALARVAVVDVQSGDTEQPIAAVLLTSSVHGAVRIRVSAVLKDDEPLWRIERMDDGVRSPVVSRVALSAVDNRPGRRNSELVQFTSRFALLGGDALDTAALDVWRHDVAPVLPTGVRQLSIKPGHAVLDSRRSDLDVFELVDAVMALEHAIAALGGARTQTVVRTGHVHASHAPGGAPLAVPLAVPAMRRFG